MIERTIGIAYCLIAIVHLIGMGIHRHVYRRFQDPELAVARMIIWPVTDAQWLVRRWRAWRAAAILIALATGATSASTGCYQEYLDSLPVVERTHNGEAVAIVAATYGIDYRTPNVRWVVQDKPFVDEDNHPVLGITHNCDSWVWWPPSYGPDPKESLVFGHTVLAHEMAHCALWLYTGDGDGDHSDVEWWGPTPPPPGHEAWLGGLVGVAMKALEDDGL